jgi:hypothetical protein
MLQPYYKPRRLLDGLEELYTIEPKLRACEMRDRMKTMKDPDDGGLLFLLFQAIYDWNAIGR